MTQILDGISDKRIRSLFDTIDNMRSTDADTLLKVIARISEASYRRGVQQGAMFSGYGGANLCKWRYYPPLSVSPMLDMRDGAPFVTGERRPSAQTLDIEYWRDLHRIGLSPRGTI